LRAFAGFLTLSTLAGAAMALDINALWDYTKPQLSEARFTAALDGASANDRLLLLTQIARTHGLRKDFAKAREILATVEPELPRASSEVRVRYLLELGRSHASAAHPQEALTPQSLEQARSCYLRAHELAAEAGLDFLAVDALHMMAVVEVEPARQLEWSQKALATMLRSDQADARGWEGSLRNNIGYARRLMGDLEGALEEFRLSRSAYERAGRARNVRWADWMIARTYREQKKYRQALALQLELERAWDASGETDPEVYEELEHLYRLLDDAPRADHYGRKFREASR
jgi:tetratricopeptide (TPR) repeat protein